MHNYGFQTRQKHQTWEESSQILTLLLIQLLILTQPSCTSHQNKNNKEHHLNTRHTTLTTSKRVCRAADSRVFTETASQTPRALIVIKGESWNVFKVSPWKWTDADALSAWGTCNRPQCGANSHSTRPRSFIKPLHWTLGSKLGVWVHHSAGTVQA